MRIHERLREDAQDPLRVFEEDMHEALLWICRSEWQAAWPATQFKYLRFAMRRVDFIEYEEHMLLKCGYSAAEDMLAILNDFVDIGEPLGVDDGFDDQDAASIQLQMYSYFGCHLDADASEGDLEYFEEVLDERDARIYRKALDIRREENDMGPLAHILNNQLESTIDSMTPFIEEGGRVIANHGLSVWTPHAALGFVLDKEVTSKGYHLLSSLLRLVEGTPGNA